MTTLSRNRIFVVAVLVLLSIIFAFAGNTGKIVGRVVDEKGEALPGAIVKVIGTNRGGVTDPDGKYTIIGVPLGSYSVEASLIGYGAVKANGLKVGADETIAQDFHLKSTTVDVPVVEITGDRMVNKMTTGSTKKISETDIAALPDVKDVQDVIKVQAGVVKQGVNLFLRGGRANEVQYLVDGVPANSIVGNSGTTAGANADLNKFYAQQSGVIGGGGGLSVSANAIQSVSVQTSGFDADYGNAQSGIISISTKSGGEKYTGSFQYRTDKLSNQNQNERYSSGSFGGPEPVTAYLLPSMGVTIPGTLTFFISADMDRADGPYNFVENSFYNPILRKAEFNGFLGGILNGLGFNFHDNQKNTFSLNSRFRYDPTKTDQVSYRYTASLSSAHDFVNTWKYRADSSNLSANISTQHALSWSHFFGANTFMRLNFGKLETRAGNDVAGLLPMYYSPTFSQQDVEGNGFYYLGSDQEWYDALTRQYSLRLDFNSQVHQYHLLKFGFELYYEEINSTEIQYPTAPITDANGDVRYPPFTWDSTRQRGEYPGYGLYRWNINAFPNHGALFVQDNIEFSGLNLHVGLRYDYFDQGRSIFYQDYVKAWREATYGMTADWVQNVPMVSVGMNDSIPPTDWNIFKYYFLHGNFSPRLSIGYPVTDRIVFYFNYGHFYQFPDRDQYYRDPFVLETDTWVGNPSLKPQRTVSYESGFEDQFTDNMSFAIRAFYKDIFDYATLVHRTSEYVYMNLDYASARGFEFSFTEAFTQNMSINASYSYQIAKGRSSNPLTSAYLPDYQLPRETRLDWDQNHTVNVFAQYRVGPNEESSIFGIPLNNYGVSLTYNFGSGFPYTPDYGVRTNSRNVYLVNNETRPFTYTVNLSLYKSWLVMGHMDLTASVDITNLLNRKNIATGSTSAGFNQNTGKPNTFGDVDPASGVIYPYILLDSRMPPYTFDAPRQILFGLRMGWN